jgi:LPXTG-site transpeptidase (sortase) family protein
MKVFRLLIFTGLLLLLAAFVIFLWNAAPFVSSRLYARSIPTAPPLYTMPAEKSLDSEPDAGELTLLPFESTGVTPTNAGSETKVSAQTPTPKVPQRTPTPQQMDLETAAPIPTPYTGKVPTHLRIPILELDAPVVPIGVTNVSIGNTTVKMWDVPDYRAAGWHNTSTRLGLPGNTVLNGHNTLSGEVFRNLYKIPVGALVLVESQDGEEFAYRVKEKYILPEAGQSLEVRLQNARYIQDTADERLTLVTCHPYGSLANRLIVIAVPAQPTPQ